MQLHFGRQVGRQLVPDTDRQVFGGAKLALQKIHIDIQVPVVHLFDHKVFDQPPEALHIEHKTGIGVRLSLDRNIKLIIIAMPVSIAAFAENLVIFLSPPAWI